MIVPSVFLSELYRDCGPCWVAAWRYDTKKTEWVSVSDLARYDAIAAECAAASGAELYFSVCPQREPLNNNQRGAEAGARYVPAVWADVDHAEGAAAKASRKPYPPRDVLLGVVRSMPVEPSVMIDTGGGYHVYWLLTSPFDLGDQHAIARGKQLVSAWQGMIAAKLRQAGGYAIDGTADLARVLRAPGTFSWRWSRMVSIVCAEGAAIEPDRWPRYDLDYLESLIPEGTAAVLPNAAAAPPVVIVRPGDPDKGGSPRLFALLENSPEFKKTWEARRTDLRDQSASGYDLSIACQLVQAGWSDQDIANAIATFRRNKFPDQTAKVTDRPDYLIRTIAKARQDRQHTIGVAALDSVEIGGPSGDDGTGNGAPGKTKIEILGETLGIKLAGVKQYGRESASARIALILADGREVPAGTIRQLIDNPGVLTAAIAAATGVTLPATSKGQWRKIGGAVIEVAEVDDLPEGSVSRRVAGDLADYLERNGINGEDDRDFALAAKKPWRDSNGVIWFPLRRFERWCGMHCASRYEPGERLAALRSMGAKKHVFAFVADESGKRTTTTFFGVTQAQIEGARADQNLSL